MIWCYVEATTLVFVGLGWVVAVFSAVGSDRDWDELLLVQRIAVLGAAAAIGAIGATEVCVAISALAHALCGR